MKTNSLLCEMEDGCRGTVSHVDEKGYVYCENHAVRRRASGIGCRKLRDNEVRRLEVGAAIRYRV